MPDMDTPTLRLSGPAIDELEPRFQDRILTAAGGVVLVAESDTGATYPLDDAPGREVIIDQARAARALAAERYNRGRAARAARADGPWPLEDLDWQALADAAWIPSQGHCPPEIDPVDMTETIEQTARWTRIADETRAMADAEIAARQR